MAPVRAGRLCYPVTFAPRAWNRTHHAEGQNLLRGVILAPYHSALAPRLSDSTWATPSARTGRASSHSSRQPVASASRRRRGTGPTSTPRRAIARPADVLVVPELEIVDHVRRPELGQVIGDARKVRGRPARPPRRVGLPVPRRGPRAARVCRARPTRKGSDPGSGNREVVRVQWSIVGSWLHWILSRPEPHSTKHISHPSSLIPITDLTGTTSPASRA